MPPKKTKEEKAAERSQLTTDFFGELAKRVPEESREYVTKLAEVAAGNAETSDYVAEHTMRLADYSRGHNALQQQRTSLEEAKERSETMYRDNVAWHAENKAAYDRMSTQLEHYKRLANADPDTGDPGEGDPTLPKTPPNGEMPGYVKEEDVKRLLAEGRQQSDREAMNYEALVAELRNRHQTTFGEFLNIRDLTDHAAKKGVRLLDAYDEVYGERLREKTDADLETRIAKERKEAAAEARAEVIRDSAALPYPIRNNEPTSVDYLTGRAAVPETGAKAAVDEYYKMQQAKES